MNPAKLTPVQMRVLCSRKELETFVKRRLSTLNKRSADSWNERNKKVQRSEVNFSTINKETFVFIASALSKCERKENL